jgi:hypothetical protein
MATGTTTPRVSIAEYILEDEDTRAVRVGVVPYATRRARKARATKNLFEDVLKMQMKKMRAELDTQLLGDSHVHLRDIHVDWRENTMEQSKLMEQTGYDIYQGVVVEAPEGKRPGILYGPTTVVARDEESAKMAVLREAIQEADTGIDEDTLVLIEQMYS